MNINDDYANLLELYASIIRGLDYDLSKEQKEIIKNLGETLFERTKENLIKGENKEHVKKHSEKIMANSEFEIIRKKKELRKKKIFNMSDVNLAKNIGKEPGE